MVCTELKRLTFCGAVFLQSLGSQVSIAESNEATDSKLEEMAFLMTPTLADPASAPNPFSLEIGLGVMQSVLNEGHTEKEERVQIPELWLKAGLFYPFSLALNLAQDERSDLSSRSAILQWSFFEEPFWPALCWRFAAGQMGGPSGILGEHQGSEFVISWGLNKLTVFAAVGIFRYSMRESLSEQEEIRTLTLASERVSKFGLFYQLLPASFSLAAEVSQMAKKSSFVGKIVAHL